MNKIFKVYACGDTVYVQAADEAGVHQRLSETMGTIPKPLLTLSEVAELPEGEDFL